MPATRGVALDVTPKRLVTPLPVVLDSPEVTSDTLAPVARQLRTVLSAPVQLTYQGTFFTIRPAEMARMLAERVTAMIRARRGVVKRVVLMDASRSSPVYHGKAFTGSGQADVGWTA